MERREGIQKPRCNANEKTSYKDKEKRDVKRGMEREGSVYSRSILHFAIPIPVLQRCIVSIAAFGRSVSSRSTRFVALTSPADRD